MALRHYVVMAKKNFAPILDAALLEPETTVSELRQLCEDAMENGYAASFFVVSLLM